MDRVIETLVWLGRLHQALRDLKDRLGQTGMPMTFRFDIIPSGDGVLVQGFLDVELPNGNAISHDLDLGAIGSKCTVAAAQTVLTPDGSEVLDSTGDLECATFEEWSSAMLACERFFQGISLKSPAFGG